MDINIKQTKYKNKNKNKVLEEYRKFLNQQQTNQFESRAIFLDIQPRTINSIQTNHLGYQIPTNNLFKGSGLNSDTFVNGRYLEGSQIVLQSLDIIRKQVQKCDRMSGFILINSMADGTGSGMAGQMISKLRQSYCCQIVQKHAILPQLQNMSSPLHIYNAVLALQYFVQQNDYCILSQNKSLQHRLFLQGNLRPTIKQVNDVHAEMIKQLTVPFRFSGSINTNQRKLITNLLPFPRQKFLISSMWNNKQKDDYLINVLKPQNYSKNDIFTNNNSQLSAKDIYTMQVNCRDNFSYESEIHEKIRLWTQKNKIKLMDWIPNSFHMSIKDQVESYGSTSLLFNSPHVKSIFIKWSDIFAKMHRRKAFQFNYLELGIDEMQFTQAEQVISDIVAEYTPYKNYFDDQFDDQFVEEPE